VDREAARADLQRIVDLFPDSELALVAEQRIGHLAGTNQMLAVHDRPHVHLPEGVKNIGLLQSSQHLTPTSRDPAITEELAKWNRSAVPFNLIYAPGQDQPTVLPELLTPGIVIEALAKTAAK